MKEKEINFKNSTTGKKIFIIFSSLPYIWLLSSILFFFIAVFIAPKFWDQYSGSLAGEWNLQLNPVFGFAGIIVYFLEPVIWHNIINSKGTTTKEFEKEEEPGQSTVVVLLKFILTLTSGMILAVPYLFFIIIKPGLRALILYTSLSFFGKVNNNSGLLLFFIIIVSIDCIIYYIDLLAPKWKYNPGKLMGGFIRFNQNRSTAVITNILLIIHTALIYTLLLNLVYAELIARPDNKSPVYLGIWWLILTVYCRVSFTKPNSADLLFFLTMKRRVLLINFLALAISYISFIWPFYFVS